MPRPPRLPLLTLLLMPAFAALAQGQPPQTGNRAHAYASTAIFKSCTSVYIDEDAGTAECDDPFYLRDGTPRSTTQRGDWVSSASLAFLPGTGGVLGPPAQGKPWWWGRYEDYPNQAAARAQADGPRLRAGAVAIDSSDAQWGWVRSRDESCRPCAIGLTGLGEFDNYSANAQASFVDRFRADRSGRATFVFRLDGTYETGNDGFFESEGGKFAFSVALYDRNDLLFIDDGDFRFYQLKQVSTAAVGFGRPGPAASPGNPLPSLGNLVGDPLLPFGSGWNQSYGEVDPVTLQWRNPRPGGGSGVVAIDPDAAEGTPFDRWYAVTLDVTEGQELTLAAALWVDATGWDRCDDKPGNGVDPSCGVGRTILDFSHTAELKAVVLSPGLTLSGSEAGVDYMALAQPVPEPRAWALMALGLGALAWRARRRAGGVSTPPAPRPAGS